MAQVWQGVLPIVPTPFAANGSVDEGSLRRLVDFAAAKRAAAVVYPGVASEDVQLTADERRRCLAVVVEAARGRLPVVAGVNSADAAEMVRLAEAVAEIGVDAVMAMAVPSMEGDYAGWFRRIAEAVDGRPIILQNLFGPRGADLSAEAMLALAKAVPAIRYVKEEGVPSGAKVSRLVAGCAADLDAVIGGGGARYLFEELERGAIATMPAIELLELHVAMLDAYRAKHRARALAIYERTLPLLLIQAPFRMRMTKLIMKHRGVIATDVVREPLPEMDAMLKSLVLEFFERAMAAREAEVA